MSISEACSVFVCDEVHVRNAGSQRKVEPNRLVTFMAAVQTSLSLSVSARGSLVGSELEVILQCCGVNLHLSSVQVER